MQYNQLYIQVDGIYHLADLGSDEVAVNIQSFDVGDIDNRFIDYSQALKLPNTPNNNKLFGHSDEFTIYSDIQNIKLPCLFQVDGVNVFGMGSYLTILSINELEYNCQIVGGAYEFLSQIKGKNADGKVKTLNDLSFDETILRSYNTWVDYVTAQTQTAFYAVADFDKTDEGKDSLDKINSVVYAANQKPFIWFKSILEKILLDNGGYTLVTDFDVPTLDAMAIPFASIKQDLDYTVILDSSDGIVPVSYPSYDTGTVGYVIPQIVPIGYNPPYLVQGHMLTNLTNDIFEEGEVANVAKGLKYTANLTGNFVFDVQILARAEFIKAQPYYVTQSLISGPYADETNLKGTISFVVYVNGVERINKNVNFTKIYRTLNKDASQLKLRYILKGNDVLDINEPINLELNQYDEVVFCVTTLMYDTRLPNETSYLNTEISKYSIDMINVIPKSGIVPMGEEISIKNNLPDITQVDFFKGFLKLFCGVLQVDNYDKIVYAYGFDRIISNKDEALDWSNKIVKRTGELNTKIGSYAKKNVLKYKDVQRSAADEGRITINETIALEVFNKGVVIFWYATEQDFIDGVFSYGTIINTTFPVGQYKYQTLAGVIEDSLLTVKDEAYIFIDNDDLEEEKVIIEFPFDACEIYQSDDKDAKKYSYAKFRDTEENILNEYTGCRLVVIDGDYKFDLNSPEGDLIEDVLVPVASSINNNKSIQAPTLISRYYTGLNKSVLRDVRYITGVEVDLRESDISLLTPFSCVYLEKYGAYFHINKVSNYIKNKLTKIDLIKI